MSEHRSSTLLTFLLGGAIGAGLALLLAPESGSEMRHKLRESVDEAGDWATETFEDARYKVTDSAEKIAQIATDKKDEVVTAFEAGKDAFHRGKERLTGES